MSEWLIGIGSLLLVVTAASLWRVARGPEAADRMMGGQLVGTTGVAVVVLIAAADAAWAALDVALVLSLLATFASVAFVKTASRDGLGDPEEDQ
ncbi:monovalent cation/H+ antiporter complex subunit F [Tranquillimonas alkanivorans]|uniref:Multisubunit sodium/proton antiporter, MrpF subunit n=1 Tax=Tranquillimonas alkanivorans TaxID=441119 RepID=A0A1I5Q0N7_9RHOB|nr:monovalent cation/H+ antiporter complex subunit F [Tranquillimonas alkanivorans]SFP39802.1 multisubunit sodium/proton antiporter, MrpF subunit [Tranquillimonas alkanivorans]